MVRPCGRAQHAVEAVPEPGVLDAVGLDRGEPLPVSLK